MNTDNTVRSSILRASIGFALALYFSPAVFANTDQLNPDYWYSIELLIFKQNETHAGNEQWPNELELGYPSELAFLISQEDHLQKQTGQTNQGILQTAKTQISPAEGSTERAPGQTNDTKTPLTDKAENPGLPDAFVLLKEDQLELGGAASQLSAKGGKSILFHQRWFQNLVPDSDFSQVLITGGQQYDKHFELEGSIGLKRSRYLHIETNLWLSHFIPNPAIWNENLAPITKKSNGFESKPFDDELISSSLSSSYAEDRALYNALDNPYLSPIPDWPILPSIPTSQTLANEVTTQIQPQAASDMQPPPAVQLIERRQEASPIQTETAMSDASNYYTHDEIVSMKQRRRMRSGETHYIDHPKFGLIIRINRFDSINNEGGSQL